MSGMLHALLWISRAQQYPARTSVVEFVVNRYRRVGLLPVDARCGS